MMVMLGNAKTYWLTTSLRSPSAGYAVGVLLSHQHNGKTFDGNGS